ncbi:MAG: hypothetical protein RQ751_13415, partial [Longimicrobiales bacterium]|nr:hypothetical protein [Longimicrobiales bacterium]
VMRARFESGQGGVPGGGFGARPGEAGAGIRAETRPAAVFVLVGGVPEVRLIQVGLNDWDNTQVVSGLDGTEELAVVGAAQLQAQQQAWLQNIRDRSGGSPFGGNSRGGRR